ncbi:MAG: aspartate aminotransferase family protein, partial [Aphanizomenon sp.]
MSVHSLIEQATNPPESGIMPSTPFDFDSFDGAVMSTYSRFPLALERGA